MGEFVMPSLGADMDAGKITEWLVRPGDTVHRGDVVAVVDTDKADVDVEIFESGVIEKILVPVGEQVAVGTPLAIVGAAPAAPPRAEGEPAAPPGAPPTHGATHGEPRPASPVVRRLADHLGIDLASIDGSGTGGSVTRADVEAAARLARPATVRPRAEPAPREASAPEPAHRGLALRGSTERERVQRDAIARLMARSKREIPHYYLATDVDFSSARAWLDRANEQRTVAERLLAAALEIKAVARAALDVPEVNGFWEVDHFTPSEAVHVGVAISLRGGGLVAPALHDPATKPLDAVMRDLRDLVTRARGGRLRSSEMSDATITVTNLGEQGVRTVFGVIFPPQVALVGLGRVAEQPWAVEGMLGVRRSVAVTLSADHRASDGARGAAFLARVDQLLQEPESL